MLKKLTDAVFAANKIHEELGGPSMDADSQFNLKAWGRGVFRLVVIGEIKRGKSSFINALLGCEELVPTHSDVATSTLYKIFYSEQKFYRVHFQAHTKKSPLNINEADLPLFGTENGNPGNEKEVDFIEVGFPSSFLKHGVVIFDTPGLGGLIREHRRITYECMPKADAVFFTTSSGEAPISQLEIDYLNDIRNITPHIFFVQTKCCSVDPEASSARKEDNLGKLSKCLGKSPTSIPYFLVDSKMLFEAKEYDDPDDLNDSGYPVLFDFIEKELLPKKHQMLTKRICKHVKPLFMSLAQKIEAQKAIHAAEDANAQALLMEKIKLQQNAIKQWEENDMPNLTQKITEQFNQLRNDTQKMCDSHQMHGEEHSKWIDKINCTNSNDELKGVLEYINSDMPASYSALSHRISTYVKTKVDGILNEMSSTVASSQVSTSTGMAVRTNPMSSSSKTLIQDDIFNILKTGTYGALAGATIASVVGGIIGSVIPVIGTIIGSGLGMAIAGVWGGNQAIAMLKTQQLATNKRQAIAAVDRAVSSMSQDSTRNVSRLISDIGDKIQIALKNCIQENKNRLSNELESIRERGRLTKEEIVRKKRSLADKEQQIKNIANLLLKADRADA